MNGDKDEGCGAEICGIHSEIIKIRVSQRNWTKKTAVKTSHIKLCLNCADKKKQELAKQKKWNYCIGIGIPTALCIAFILFIVFQISNTAPPVK